MPVIVLAFEDCEKPTVDIINASLGIYQLTKKVEFLLDHGTWFFKKTYSDHIIYEPKEFSYVVQQLVSTFSKNFCIYESKKFTHIPHSIRRTLNHYQDKCENSFVSIGNAVSFEF
ncbi:hypothetical protein [Carp edema virus]|nr:hypothetical protein [Carp edema virus]